MVTHKNARTCFVEGGLSRYAYRRFGKDAGTPIILLQPFTGGLDHWDPRLTDGLARHRTVIIVDNAGVGSSGGSAPFTIEGIKRFVDTLSLETFDLLGFSMGGMVAQAFAKINPERIRRLVLVSTSLRGGDPSPHQAEVSQRARGSAGEEDIACLFFGRSSAALSAARAFWHRRHERTEDVDPPGGIETITRIPGMRLISSIQICSCGICASSWTMRLTTVCRLRPNRFSNRPMVDAHHAKTPNHSPGTPYQCPH